MAYRAGAGSGSRDVRQLVFALDADTAGQQQWQVLTRQAALRGKRVAASAAAYGGYKDVSEAWAAGVLIVGSWSREAWDERVAIMMTDGGVPRADAARLAWESGQPPADP